jgi:cytochrome c oxidase subunit II
VLLASLTTGHKLGLGLVAGVFIAFALLSSLVIPRYRPDFPSEKGFKFFILASVALFVAMLLAIELFGAEPKEPAAESAAVSTTAPTTTPTSPAPAPTAAQIAHGKALYTSLGCIGCHSLDGSPGTGPTWKGLSSSQVTLTNGQTLAANAAYLSDSITDPDAQIVKGYAPGLMSAVIKKGQVSPSDAAALVAFIQSQK